uniref:Uncharacterized protein n=1 Tax=Geospiza parvula TaxID=87175 RepID=A0A8U8AXQ0_GEOPR
MAAAAGGAAGERRIMCVGLVCLDIISVVEAFPAEDSDTRYRQRGLRCARTGPVPTPAGYRQRGLRCARTGPVPTSRRVPAAGGPVCPHRPWPTSRRVRCARTGPVPTAAPAGTGSGARAPAGTGAVPAPALCPPQLPPRRCLSQRWQRGGNASNSCTVLALLGAPCAFMGSLAPPGPPLSKCGAEWGGTPAPAGHRADPPRHSTGPSVFLPPASTLGAPPARRSRLPARPRRSGGGPQPALCPPLSFIAADFQRRGVDTAHVAWQPRGAVPCACCLVSAASGSRTIVLHDTNLPDVTARDFERVDLSRYRWIHFEARNAAEQGAMLERVERHNRAAPPERRVRTSVELEKPREELLPLMGRGQVVRGRGDGRDGLSRSPVPIPCPDPLSRSPVPVICPHRLSPSPVPIACPGRGQRRGGGEVGTGAVRSAAVGGPGPGESARGVQGWGVWIEGCGRALGARAGWELRRAPGAQAGSGSSGGLRGRRQGTDLTAPGWGYRGLPRPSPSPPGVHQQGPGPALRVPIGPRGAAGAAGAHPARGHADLRLG